MSAATAAEARLNSPLFDRTQLEAHSQEFRVASERQRHLQWLVGAFFEDVDRNYGQTLPTPGYDAITERLFGVPAAQSCSRRRTRRSIRG